MIAALSHHLFSPVAAVRVFLFVRLFYLLLAVDIWLHFVDRAPDYDLGGFNVAHFAWIDAIQSTPTPRLYTTLMILVSFGALVVALTGLNRIIMGMTFVLFTYGWMLSQLDSWQHHYFISLVLGLSLFLPNVSAEQAAERSDPSQPPTADNQRRSRPWPWSSSRHRLPSFIFGLASPRWTPTGFRASSSPTSPATRISTSPAEPR